MTASQHLAKQHTFFINLNLKKNVCSNVEQQNYFLKREATQRDFVSGSSDKWGPVQKKRYYYISQKSHLVVSIKLQKVVMTSSEWLKISEIFFIFSFTPFWPSSEVIKFNLIYHQLKKFTWPLSGPVPTKFFKIDYSFSSALPKMLIC